MSKKMNTLLFILGATAFQLVLTLVSFALLMVIYVKLVLPVLPESAGPWGLPILLIGALAISFVVYRLILKQIIKRVDMEKYFDPIFTPRKGGKMKSQE